MSNKFKMFKKYIINLKLLINSLLQKGKNKFTLIKTAINIKINNFNNIQHSFLFTAILHNLNLNIPDDSDHHSKFAFGILLLSLICLLNFINVVGYLTSLYLISKYDVEIKFLNLNR